MRSSVIDGGRCGCRGGGGRRRLVGTGAASGSVNTVANTVRPMYPATARLRPTTDREADGRRLHPDHGQRGRGSAVRRGWRGGWRGRFLSALQRGEHRGQHGQGYVSGSTLSTQDNVISSQGGCGGLGPDRGGSFAGGGAPGGGLSVPGGLRSVKPYQRGGAYITNEGAIRTTSPPPSAVSC